MLPHKVDDGIEFLHVVDKSVLLYLTQLLTNMESSLYGLGRMLESLNFRNELVSEAG